jgi:ectoine hydroxylase-related dioxygenase (phytanoyl-CoA dioxygenase family)
MFGCLGLLDSFVRVYGHPDLLAVAEAVNGPDFTPFNEGLFIKQPGLGPSVAWHQDGQNHWGSPDLDAHTHGFNFQVQVYGSTAANGVWVVPGSHRMGKIDIKALVEANGGSDRLPDAVPLVCRPGDAFITSRQTLHGSFPNVSADPRVTVNFGFHRHRSVIDQEGTLTSKGQRYDAAYVRQRCRAIAVAVDARAQRHPEERRFAYQPFVGHEDENRFTDENRREVLAPCYLNDLAI